MPLLWVGLYTVAWFGGRALQQSAMKQTAARLAEGRVDGLPTPLVTAMLHALYELGTVPTKALDALRQRHTLPTALLNTCIALDTATGRYAEALEWRRRCGVQVARPQDWLALRINEAEALANLGRLEEALVHPDAPEPPPLLRRAPLSELLPYLALAHAPQLLCGLVALTAAFVEPNVRIPALVMVGSMLLATGLGLQRWLQADWATLGLAAHRAWVLAELGRVAEGRAALAAVTEPTRKLGRYEAEWHFSRFALSFAERDFEGAEQALAAAAGVAQRTSTRRNLDFLRGRLAWARGRATDAVAHFERGAASPYQHQGGAALLDWADALISLGRGAEARQAWERCLAQDPQSPAAKQARLRLDAPAT